MCYYNTVPLQVPSRYSMLLPTSQCLQDFVGYTKCILQDTFTHSIRDSWKTFSLRDDIRARALFVYQLAVFSIDGIFPFT